jgi:hypothetical protein
MWVHCLLRIEMEGRGHTKDDTAPTLLFVNTGIVVGELQPTFLS